jgi:hypothetical protein
VAKKVASVTFFLRRRIATNWRIARIRYLTTPSSLSDVTLSYCGKAGFAHFLRASSLNRMTIRFKSAQKLPQTGLPLATDG